MSNGQVYWLYGLSGAGKTTLAETLENSLLNRNINIKHLDGDRLRSGLNSDLTYSGEDRIENLRRIAEVSKLFAENFQFVIVSAITPLEECKDAIRKTLGTMVKFIFCDCSLKECERRDPKGLYLKARSGEISHFTGVSDRFDVGSYDLVVNTERDSLADCQRTLENFIFEE
jgi:adenylyl-sulfate kinase